jgi:hypothetical protein
LELTDDLLLLLLLLLRIRTSGAIHLPLWHAQEGALESIQDAEKYVQKNFVLKFVNMMGRVITVIGNVF